MGENECLGWFPRYTPSKPMCNDVGSATQVWNGSQMPSAEYYAKASSSDAKFLAPPNYPQLLAVCEDIKKELLQELGSNPHKVVFDTPNCKVSYKDDKIVVDELTTISEDRAQMLDEAFKNVRKAVGGFPFFTLLSKRKARKHYKPKFTL